MVFHQIMGALTDDDMRPVILVNALEAARRIDGVPDDGVVQAVRTSHVAHNDLAGVQADAVGEKRLSLGLPLLPEHDEPLLTEEGRTARRQRMLCVRRRSPPEGHDAIPYELVDRTLFQADLLVHLSQVFGELIHEGFGGELLRDRSKSFDIGKENGEVCPIAPKVRFLAGSQDFPDRSDGTYFPKDR